MTSNTQWLLQRAAQLDPAAWATPLLSRLQARRNKSYEDALKEQQANGTRAPRQLLTDRSECP